MAAKLKKKALKERTKVKGYKNTKDDPNNTIIPTKNMGVKKYIKKKTITKSKEKDITNWKKRQC